MILHRYVFWELAGPTLLGLVVFTFILLATHLFRLTDLLLNRGLNLSLFLSFVGTLLPPLLILTAPMALLVGVLIGVGRLSADNEIMAMRTSGVHLIGVFVPVFSAAVLLAGGLWIANRSWVPALMDLNRELLDTIKYVVATRLEEGRVIAPPSDTDVALYFKRRSPITGRMEGIMLKVTARDAEDARDKTEILATAQEGHIYPDPFGGVMDFVLRDGSLLHFDAATTATDFRHVVTMFEELRWHVSLAGEDRESTKVQQMATHKMRALIKSGNVREQQKRGAMIAEIQQRRSIPLACVAFALLGVPLAIRVRPTGKAVAFSIAFGLIFFYYVMLKWGVSLSQNGSAVGVLVIFLPNMVVGGFGVFLFHRILRQ